MSKPEQKPEQKKDKPDPFTLMSPRQHYKIAISLAFGSALSSLVVGIFPFIGTILSTLSLFLGFIHVRVGDWKKLNYKQGT